MTDDTSAVEELRAIAASGDVAAFLAKARDLHPSDLADVLEGIEDDVRLRLVAQLPADIVSEALVEMDEEEHPEELLASLGTAQAATIVAELEDDDAVDLIGELDADDAARILSSVADRADLERLMRYDEETAGGLMTTAVVAIEEGRTAADAIEDIRRQAQEVGEFYQVYCVDAGKRLVGILPLKGLVIAGPDALVRDLMEPAPATVSPNLDQEEVARLIARYNVPAIPVVDATGVLLGRVTFDDVIDVVEKERTEDMLQFGGLSADEALGGQWHEAVRSRLPWLYLNLLTAVLAGAVVLAFKETVGRIVALAALMPIVAGLGGNAGTQSLAVTLRRLTLGLSPDSAEWRLIGKEVLVGMVNGVAVGLVVGLVTFAIGQGWALGAVVMLAMCGNQVVAAAMGATVPLVLRRLGVDPAVASSVFITAATDVVGFFLLLGLATILLLPGV
ncbi:MAG TPA: magnesium transporter [Gemmatimonadales bacterium]|jgi:magnesium transporter